MFLIVGIQSIKDKNQISTLLLKDLQPVILDSYPETIESEAVKMNIVVIKSIIYASLKVYKFLMKKQ